MSYSRQFARRAFTLLEVLIVVLILGVLAGIVVVTIDNTKDSAAQVAFGTSVQYLARQGYVYYVRTGEYLEDSSSGRLPSGFEAYVSRSDFESATPIGGVWDAEDASDFDGVVSAIGVHFQQASDRKDDAYMTEVDAIIDDGNLSTGKFQKIASDRYYYLIVGD